MELTSLHEQFTVYLIFDANYPFWFAVIAIVWKMTIKFTLTTEYSVFKKKKKQQKLFNNLKMKKTHARHTAQQHCVHQVFC